MHHQLWGASFLLFYTIQYLKDNGLWIIGTDGKAENYYYEQDLTGPIALVIGSEGFGMNRLVSENCDILVKIPMKGKVTSSSDEHPLNALCPISFTDLGTMSLSMELHSS